MKPRLRVGALVALVACGVALIAVLHRARVQPPQNAWVTLEITPISPLPSS